MKGGQIVDGWAGQSTVALDLLKIAHGASTNRLRNAKILHCRRIAMPHAAVNGTNIHYHESGHGLPVVLLHGFPLDHRVWHKQVHDLSHVCRVITPDLRGFGHSTGGGSFTIASLADDIYVLLSQIHALPCVLGGLSMGGYVALEYERHNAATLRGLMLIDTRSGADSPEGRAGRDVMIEVAKTQGSVAIANKMLPKMLAGGNVDEDSPVVRELKSIMDACPAQTIQYALAAMRDRIDYTPTLSRIAAPTLIVAGESDVLTPPAQSEEMHKAIKGSTISIIPGAGHMAPMEQAQQVSRAIREFLTKLGS
jgi:3-oxoadipate enol-lactonase